ncbi:MAG TPA: hypothetical protein VKV40_04785 [Ktedonobacteraceae bacterium]|nr:hypothetical protein [Ktedonobacteraceae bacterium]
MLIIGVLFVVALLAIGGAFWLAVGERQQNGNAPAPEAASPGQQTPVASVPATEGLGAAAGRTAAAPPVPREPGEIVPPAPVSPAAYTERPFSTLNGQFYELAAELRALYSEAQEIERRLGILNEMVSRIEREYGEVSLETK